MTQDADFKGYIHDVGGPTANFRGPACAKQRTRGACTDRRCLGTKPCPAMKADHRDYTGLLRKLRKLPGVKKVFVRSGMGFRHGIALSNGVGVIDSDYRGEISVGLVNLSQDSYTIQPGDRIAQLMVTPVVRPVLVQAEELDETDRGAGGFGSTGR